MPTTIAEENRRVYVDVRVDTALPNALANGELVSAELVSGTGRLESRGSLARLSSSSSRSRGSAGGGDLGTRRRSIEM